MSPYNWDELKEIDKKILKLAGVTRTDVEVAREKWYGTVYPYDVMVPYEGWVRFYLTQSEVNEIYHDLRKAGSRIRNMGGYGRQKSELPKDALTVGNINITDTDVEVIYPGEAQVSEAEGLKVVAEKLIELENRLEALEGE